MNTQKIDRSTTRISAVPAMRAALAHLDLEFRKFLARHTVQDIKSLESRLTSLEANMRISELGGMHDAQEIGTYGRDYAEHQRLCERLRDAQDALQSLGL